MNRDRFEAYMVLDIATKRAINYIEQPCDHSFKSYIDASKELTKFFEKAAPEATQGGNNK